VIRSALLGLMKAAGLPAQSFASAEEFLNSASASDCVSDRGYRIRNVRSGLQAKLNAERCMIPTIFITAHGEAKIRMQR